MFAHTRAGTIGAALVTTVLIAVSLSGCSGGPPTAMPTPTSSPTAVAYDTPEEGWCAAYGITLNRWSGASLEIDETRFDEVIGMDFIGPADCYLELYSDITLKSVVAVFIGERMDVAEFMTSALPDQGWDGAIPDPRTGGVFTHPDVGDLGYSFSADGALDSIPVDGPAVQVTALLAS